MTVVNGRRLAATLAACGAMGAFAGAAQHPTWQDAIEPAQALARLVEYPLGNVNYLSDLRTWTVLHQVCALLLRAGMSERVLAYVLSALIGAVSLQAIGLVALALTGDAALAIGAAAFVYVTNTSEGGITYPVNLVGTSATYGALGLALFVIVIALVALGWWRSAAFLLGLLPAVHPSIGLWGLAIVPAAVLWNRAVRDGMLRAWPALVGGLALTLASVGVQFALAGRAWLPAESAPLSAEMVRWVRYWDGHRRPFPIVTGAMALVGLTAVTSVAGLTWLRDRFEGASSFLFHALLVAFAIGGTLSISYWFDQAPLALVALMPSRLLNLGVMTCAAMLIGVAWRYPSDPIVQPVLALLVVGLCVWSIAATADPARVDEHVIRVAGLLLLVVVSARARATAAASTGAPLRGLRTVVVAAPLLAFLLLPATARGAVAALGGSRGDAALAAAARGHGMLLTSGDLRLVQAQTRRPVLFDGGQTDMLVYMPDLAADSERIIRDVYAADLLQAPDGVWEARRASSLLKDLGQGPWQRRTPEQWRQLAGTFGFTQVLAYRDWPLQLPIAAQSDRLTLYDLPRGDADRP